MRYCLREAGATLDDVTAVAYYEDARLSSAGCWPPISVPPTWPGVLPGHPAAVVGLEAAHHPPGGTRTRGAEPRHGATDFGTQAPRIPCGVSLLPQPVRVGRGALHRRGRRVGHDHLWHGRGDRLDQLAELRFPHSLGLLYSAFTYFCGFKVDSGEYKLMGLAPYGQPASRTGSGRS
ncbi:carbamoyltransferase N-terminal domain-containing protein [Micromonospora sp. M12]